MVREGGARPEKRWRRIYLELQEVSELVDVSSSPGGEGQALCPSGSGLAQEGEPTREDPKERAQEGRSRGRIQKKAPRREGLARAMQ